LVTNQSLVLKVNINFVMLGSDPASLPGSLLN